MRYLLALVLFLVLPLRAQEPVHASFDGLTLGKTPKFWNAEYARLQCSRSEYGLYECNHYWLWNPFNDAIGIPLSATFRIEDDKLVSMTFLFNSFLYPQVKKAMLAIHGKPTSDQKGWGALVWQRGCDALFLEGPDEQFGWILVEENCARTVF